MYCINRILKLANNKVTVACSSGVDSIAVAHFLLTKYPQIDLSIFHFNHGLREQNDLMQEKVKNFCDHFNITSHTVKNDDSRLKSEADLRHARYGAMRQLELGYVVTAHHLDDACESHMMNFLQGNEEYVPIPPMTVYESANLVIIRPFILNKKQELYDYAVKNNLIQYVVEDETNKDNTVRRNWIRNVILPQFIEKGYNLYTIVRKKYLGHMTKYFST
jgi:tRNA(Ile)-lysidine synthase